MTLRSVATPVVYLLGVGVLALFASVSCALASVSFTGPDSGTQSPAQLLQKSSVLKPSSPRLSVAQSAAPAAPSAPVRTETITYDVWTVTCRDTADGKTKKVCSATLPMQVQQDNRLVNLGTWLIAHNTEGALVSVVQTPQIDIGVLIAKGVELKLGNGTPHALAFVNCNPQRCEALMPMDTATIKEAVAAPSAVVRFWKADGSALSINIQSIKGIDKAIAAVR